MPLILPTLDDRTYTDLVDEALSLIPTYAPEWTNQNPSDPGVTLVELFAYLTEMLTYRLNRVTPANVRTFLRLLNGPDWQPSDQKTLAQEISETVTALRRSDRAITAADFESLTLSSDPQVARARCVPRRNLEPDDLPDRLRDKPGHVSVVIVPQAGTTQDQLNQLIGNVSAYLDDRRMLTTKVHVIAARYVQVGVHFTLHLQPDAVESDVQQAAVNALLRFLDPLVGGDDGNGWPFGRNVYVSEIFNLLNQLPGVDYVRDDNFALTVDASQGARLARNSLGDVVAVLVQADELVNAQITPADIKVQLPWSTQS